MFPTQYVNISQSSHNYTSAEFHEIGNPGSLVRPIDFQHSSYKILRHVEVLLQTMHLRVVNLVLFCFGPPFGVLVAAGVLRGERVEAACLVVLCTSKCVETWVALCCKR